MFLIRSLCGPLHLPLRWHEDQDLLHSVPRSEGQSRPSLVRRVEAGARPSKAGEVRAAVAQRGPHGIAPPRAPGKAPARLAGASSESWPVLQKSR